MKKKIVVLLSLVMVLSMLLCGCKSHNFEENIEFPSWVSYEQGIVSMNICNNDTEDIYRLEGTLCMTDGNYFTEDEEFTIDVEIPSGEERECEIKTERNWKNVKNALFTITSVNDQAVQIEFTAHIDSN